MATQENIERIEAALRQLADLIAGDLPVCEVSRVLRLPGSHNTKRGEWNSVEVIELHPDRRYELDDLEEWFAEQSPIRLLFEAAQNVERATTTSPECGALHVPSLASGIVRCSLLGVGLADVHEHSGEPLASISKIM
jgi:hypothetical protein